MNLNMISGLLWVIGVLVMLSVDSTQSIPRNPDSSLVKRDYPPPCLCRNRYYKFCPEDCQGPRSSHSVPMEVTVTSRPITVLDESTSKTLHGFYADHHSQPDQSFHPDQGIHPDHGPDSDPTIIQADTWSTRGNVMDEADTNGGYRATDPTGNQETIVRHRKVYVANTDRMFDVPIHPIKLTIPIKIQNPAIDALPPPKPIFRMHKYTTVETKPQVEMVPVTTTIIKPVGVSKDQIIEDK